MNEPSRVAITGCGAITPLGPDAPGLWAGLANGRLAVRRTERLASAPVDLAAEVEPGRPADLMGWARGALKEALHDAGLDWPPKGNRAALGLSIGWHWPDNPSEAVPSPLGMDPADLGWQGPDESVFNSYSACAAGLQLVEEAARCIRLGHADLIVVVASDSRVNRAAVEGYARLGALAAPWPSDPAASCRPFDRERSGFVVGEGAAALVLESAASAAARRVTVRAWVAGAASSCDAGSPVAPDPAGAAAENCVRLALARAGLGPGDLGYINAHGTGTPLNDRVEADVLARVLGPEAGRVPCGSFKSMLGHLAMACGLVELVGCLPILAGTGIPKNRNLDQPDAPLRLSGWDAGDSKVSALMKLSFGFGGMNTGVVLTRGESGISAGGVS